MRSGGNSEKGQQNGRAGNAGRKSGIRRLGFCSNTAVVVEEEANDTGRG